MGTESVYRDLLGRLLTIADNGEIIPDRTGTGVSAIFGERTTFDISNRGLPLITSRAINYAASFAELAWMLSGSTNIKALGAKIWDAWADSDGELGPVYGHQWRDNRIDQIGRLREDLVQCPESRRLMVDIWSPHEVDQMRLPPCHFAFQLMTKPNAKGGFDVDCATFMRSVDVYLGLPFDLINYAALTHILCDYATLKSGVSYEARNLTFLTSHTHLYSNHLDQARKLLDRPLIEGGATLGTFGDNVILSDWRNLNSEMFIVRGYNPMSPIPAPVAI